MNGMCCQYIMSNRESRKKVVVVVLEVCRNWLLTKNKEKDNQNNKQTNKQTNKTHKTSKFTALIYKKDMCFYVTIGI